MKLKKVLGVSFAALLVTAGLVSCGEPATEITSVSISNKATLSTDLYLQDTRVLEFNLSAVKDNKDFDITFADAIEKEYVKLYSSDEAKVSVDKEGKVTALATGEATITVESTKDSTVSDSIKFTVFDRSVVVDSVTISNEGVFAPNMAINTVKTLELALTAHTGRNDSVTLTAADAITQKLISVKAEDAAILEVDGLSIKAKAEGTTKLKVLSKDNATLKEITVKVVDRVEGQPTIKLVGEKEGGYTARQGDSIEVPTAVAYDKDGNDVSNYITVTSDKDPNGVFANDGEFSSKVVGAQTLTFTSKDKDGTVLGSKSITVNVYQRIFTDGGAAEITVENEATAPVAKSTNTGNGLKAFYLPSGASKQYYAEWKVSKISNIRAGKNMLICAANITNDTCEPTESMPMTYFGYKPSDTGAELANSKTVNSWNLMWEPRMWSATDMLNGVTTLDVHNGDTRLGVARNGDNVYYFLNGALAYVDVNPDLFELDSRPGIALVGDDEVAPDVTLSDFTILEGAAAVAKINEAKPESQFRYFSPSWANTLAKQPASFQKDGFTYLDKIADENIGGINDALVTTNELYANTLTKKWKVSFDMQATKFGDGNNWGKVTFDLRSFHDKAAVTQLYIEQWQRNFTGVGFNSSEIGAANSDHLTEFKTALEGTSVTDKLHFEFSCYTVDFNEEMLEVKVSTLGENPKSWSIRKSLAYNEGSKAKVSSPKYLVWHSQKWSGVVSNYSLSFEDVVPETK